MQNEEVVIQLHLDDIIPNRFQPREVFDDQALKELAVSIKEHGVIQPIIVRKIGEKYEIIAGERRYKASSLVGLTTIPAIVKNLDDKQSSKVALIENLQRRDLTPIEEARTYQKILDIDNLTQEELAKSVGKSQSSVANKLRLLTLPEEVQQALLKEQISERHARSLINLEDKNKQIALLNEIIEKRLPVREVDARIKKMNEAAEAPETPVNDHQVLNVDVQEEETQEGGQVNSNIYEGARASNISPILSLDELDSAILETIDSDVDAPIEILDVSDEVNTAIETLESLTPVDQTVVDIEKIREQSSDINQPNLKGSNIDMSHLLKAEEGQIVNLDNKEEDINNNNKFLPESQVETSAYENKGIGEGLLAGMPIIHREDGSNITAAAPVVSSNTHTGLSGIIEQEDSLDDNKDTQFIHTPQAGQDFSNNEEIKFATVAIGNIVRDLESKGFKVDYQNNANNGQLEIVLKIGK